MVVSNHVNSDHVPSFSCLDVWNVKTDYLQCLRYYCNQTSAYHSRRWGRLYV